MTSLAIVFADRPHVATPHGFRSRLTTGTLLVLAALLAGADARALTNGVALAPPMGYNSWYGNTANNSDALIRSVADQMATNGMRDVGYQYVNMDDGWAGSRDTSGTIIPVLSKFPNGMKAVADYVHSRGLKFGLYTTGSTNTCGYYAGSIDHEIQDANTYAQWGVDFVKFEACLIPWYELFPEAQVLSVRMQQALLHSGRPMVFSLSTGAFENWMPRYSNMPRGTGDYDGTWATILYHIDVVASSPFIPGPGIWNDPDVVDIGTNFSTVQNTSIFSMWCQAAAPLIVPFRGCQLHEHPMQPGGNRRGRGHGLESRGAVSPQMRRSKSGPSPLAPPTPPSDRGAPQPRLQLRRHHRELERPRPACRRRDPCAICGRTISRDISPTPIRPVFRLTAASS